MEKKTYNRLLNIGFDMKQINQIEIIAKNFEDTEESIDYVLNFATPSNSIEILRDVGNILKSFKTLEDDEVNTIMNLLKLNIAPNIFIDNFINTDNYSKDKSKAIQFLLNKIEKTGFIRTYSFGTYNIFDVINEIKKCKVDNILYDTIKKIDNVNRFNPLEVIRKDFDTKQMKLALKYCTYGYNDLVDDIPKLNKLYDDMNCIFIIRDLKLPFVDLVNNYEDLEILNIVKYAKEGINVLPYLLNKPYKNKTNLCAFLIDELNLSNEEIKTCLKKIPYDYNKYEKDCWKILIRGTIIGIDFTNYFERVPTKKSLELIEFLHLKGYKKEEIKKFYESYKHNTNYFSDEIFEDFLNIIELQIKGYDISNIIKHSFNGKDVELAISIAKKYSLDEQYIFDNTIPKQLELINKLNSYNREDLAIPLLKCKKINLICIDKIEDLLINDLKNKEHHNIINLLFDKGNDVFNEFDNNYEFSAIQKILLTESIILKIFDDKSIDIIRDINIADEKIKELILIKHKGHDISGIIPKVTDLSVEQIKKLGECLSMGFDLIPHEDKEK